MKQIQLGFVRSMVTSAFLLAACSGDAVAPAEGNNDPDKGSVSSGSEGTETNGPGGQQTGRGSSGSPAPSEGGQEPPNEDPTPQPNGGQEGMPPGSDDPGAGEGTAPVEDPPVADAGAMPMPGQPSGPGATAKFSFFVTSLKGLQTLSKSDVGFGGDLRFGKETGLEGADEICRQLAEMAMPGAGQKAWRAFLSAMEGPNGGPVHARDRIGEGPWYDRNDKLIADDLEDLLSGERPGGDPEVAVDLTNERGEPNHHVGPEGFSAGRTFDNHDTITGSDTDGRLRATAAADTCNDWTSTEASGRPYCGHSWPRNPRSGRQWASDHRVSNCKPGIDRTLGGSGSTIGSSGGYGGFYCFALSAGD